MRKICLSLAITLLVCSFAPRPGNTTYYDYYFAALDNFEHSQDSLLRFISTADISSAQGVAAVKGAIEKARLKLKAADIWLRYFEPVAYKKINGPLPVEWENEVFEKYEKPYKREGAGLALAEIYLGSEKPTRDSVAQLIRLSAHAINTYRADSITEQLKTFGHFYFCNRLYLLNLAAIYTTGFECPGKQNVIPELRAMLVSVRDIYLAYNRAFSATPLTREYLDLYDRAIAFANAQPADINAFDHFTFLKNYVNPLFAINQQLIRLYNARTISFNDYTLNSSCNSIFDKCLYTPQNTKGIYSLVQDEGVLDEIKATGRVLFYDPILSGNNERSCASCHKSEQFFTDTSAATSLQFDKSKRLPRNTPSLVNVVYNHLLMLDGRHYTLQKQGVDVMTNPIEMGGNEKEIVAKVMSCKEYRNAFKKFLKYTPGEKEVTLEHIASAITFYYGGFSKFFSPFDSVFNQGAALAGDAAKGFNLFMGKAQCATCHYVPLFNGVPPPYISSEFEVIGVPADARYSSLSADSGRYRVNPAGETMNAFRTGTIRNARYTAPYMHNGVFKTMEEVVAFYDAGGGQGRKLSVANQTLAADSLRLSQAEKKELIAFINSLNENVIFTEIPDKLPVSSNKQLNSRRVGGDY